MAVKRISLSLLGALALHVSACGTGVMSDSDNDGVSDELDNCAATPNPDQADTDADGAGDACDLCLAPENPASLCVRCATVPNPGQTDTDGDGVPDACDNCPTVTNPLQEDENNLSLDPIASVGDACDTDADEVDDATDNCPGLTNPDQSDLDGDEAGDPCDPDDDGDGFCDPGESGAGCSGTDSCPLVADPDQTDLDGDTIGDACDLDDDSDGIEDIGDVCPTVADPMQEDLDADGLGDACDPDDDDDGFEDVADNCPRFPDPAQLDSDGDEIGDVCDPDRDGDGRPNGSDTCPDVADPAQADLDGDGIGDACDPDLDGDGVSNATDNCPNAANMSQQNLDGDPLGDACDPDRDGDGNPNTTDPCPDDDQDLCLTGMDTDRDGVDDGADNCPLVSNPSQLDTDNDRIGDACDPDDDGDGRCDPGETGTSCTGSDNCPLISNTNQADLDGDMVGDVCDPDRDGDGVANTTDNCPSTANPSQGDLDTDGIGNACDTDIDGDAIANSSDNCPSAANPLQSDGDGDGHGDACDNCPALSNSSQSDGDSDGAGDGCDNCPGVANDTQADLDRDGIGDACDPVTNYAGWLALRYFRDWNWVDAIGVLGRGSDWPLPRQWADSSWFGYTAPDRPAAQGTWMMMDLAPPLRPSDFVSRSAGSALRYTTTGRTPMSVPWDATDYPGFAAYMSWNNYPFNRWGFGASYSVSAPGGASVPPDLAAFTVPAAIRTPADFAFSPSGFSTDLTAFQDSDFTFTWTPGPASGTRVDFRITSGSRILQYWANDSAGSLTIPAALLRQLPIGRAFYSFVRTVETPVPIGGDVYLGVGYIETEGSMRLVPPCDQTESEPNDSIASADDIALSSTQMNFCGTYGSRGDADFVAFAANAGQLVSVRTYAVEVGSPIDTVIELIAPDGSIFATNDNASASTNDSSLVQSLPTSGTWRVSVRHKNPSIVGGPTYQYNLLLQLRTIAGTAIAFPGTGEGSSPTASCFSIPDAAGYFTEGTPAVCTIDVSGLPASTSDVQIVLDVVHQFQSDVRLELEHAGRTVVLTNHTGKLRAVFDQEIAVDDRTNDLNTFDGVDPNGTWTLRATDWYAGNTGQIRSVVLYVVP